MNDLRERVENDTDDQANLMEIVAGYACNELCKYPYMIEDESIMIENCKKCQMESMVFSAMAAGLEKFQNDLIVFAEKNWAPAHIEMLKSAMQCVLDGKEVYAPIEEDEDE